MLKQQQIVFHCESVRSSSLPDQRFLRHFWFLVFCYLNPRCKLQSHPHRRPKPHCPNKASNQHNQALRRYTFESKSCIKPLWFPDRMTRSNWFLLLFEWNTCLLLWSFQWPCSECSRIQPKFYPHQLRLPEEYRCSCATKFYVQASHDYDTNGFTSLFQQYIFWLFRWRIRSRRIYHRQSMKFHKHKIFRLALLYAALFQFANLWLSACCYCCK